MQIRLLLIEDNLDVVDVLTKLLSRSASARFSIHASTSLKHGLEAAAQGGFDAVLLDLTLPDSAGRETFQRLRAAAPVLPVIILTGTDDEELAVKLVQEGAQDYFVKGESDTRLLVRAIRYALERHRIEQALQAERNFLRKVINSLPEMIYVKDREGRYIANNPAHIRFLGANDAEAVVGYTVSDFLPEEQAKRFNDHDQEIMRSREPVLERVESAAGAEGVPPRWLSTSKVPLLDNDGEVIGLVGSVRDITEQTLAAERLAESEAQLHALAVRLQTVREEDRTRIARDLHDRIGQELAALRMELLGLGEEHAPQDGSLREKALAMARHVESAIKMVREICGDLRPRMLDDLGLVAALEWSAQRFQERTGIICSLSAAEEIEIDRAGRTAFYRIAQEALTNVLRHSQATQVAVDLRRRANCIELTVRDNGRGITSQEMSQRESLGLLGMRERMQAFGGSVHIVGVFGRGTTIVTRLPA